MNHGDKSLNSQGNYTCSKLLRILMLNSAFYPRLMKWVIGFMGNSWLKVTLFHIVAPLAEEK